MTGRKTRLVFLVCVMAGTAFAVEEDGRKKVEVRAAVGIFLPSLDTSYDSIYSPPFSGQTISSSATQTLSLTAARKAGLSLCFAYLPRERIGIQVLVDTFDTSIKGESSRHEVELDYIARQPPDYVPREFRTESARDWPDPEGNLKNVAFSGNLLLATRGERVRGAFSGGLSIFRTQATVRSLAYTSFWEGGHSVLFSETYELEFEVEPLTQLGLNFGGELSIALGPRVSLSIDGRYFYAPSKTANVRLTDIINIDEIILRDPIETVEKQMDPAPIEIDPSFFRLGFGLKLRF